MAVAVVMGGSVGVLGRTHDRCFDTPVGDVEFTDLGVEVATGELGPFVCRGGQFDGEHFHERILSNTCSICNL